MADPTPFDFTAERLERSTPLDQLAARGTLRLALKAAGLDPGAADRAAAIFARLGSR